MSRFTQAIIASFCFTVLIPYCTLINHIDQYEVGIARDSFTGELTLQERGGFYLTAPWIRVASIDTRPTRVCITSTTRAYNCKLVRFVPSAYQEFVATQGFRYYWWANRFSFNIGYEEEYRGMRDILRGYAFSPQRYPFLEILEDYTGPTP